MNTLHATAIAIFQDKIQDATFKGFRMRLLKDSGCDF